MSQHHIPQTSHNSLPVPHRPARARVSSQQRAQPAAGTFPNITLAFLWQVFCWWWKWAFPAGLLLAGIASGLVWHLHVPEYQARALVIIQSNTPYIAFQDRLDSSRLYVQTQIELLRSPVVLGPLISRPEIASMEEIKTAVDPMEHLSKHLGVGQVGQSELYNISYRSPSAEDAATIANSLVAEYLRIQSTEDKKRSQLVIAKLEEGRLGRTANLERLRRRVIDLAKEITGKDPFAQDAITDVSRALSPVGSLFQRLNEVEVEREVLQVELQTLQDKTVVSEDQAEASGLPDLEIANLDLEIANREDVRQLESNIASLQEQMAYVKNLPRYRIGETWKNDPTYLQLKEQSEQLTGKLTELKTMLRKDLYTLSVEQRNRERQRAIDDMKRQLTSLDTKKSLLEGKLEKHIDELKLGGAQSAQLEFAKSELAREERVFELIAARKLALQTEIEAPTRVSLKNTASVPTKALEPIPFKKMLVACLASLACPFGLALLKEMVTQRIATANQLASESLLPSLGEIARYPVRPAAAPQKALSSRQQQEMFVFAESIDCFRTQLMLTQDVGTKDQHRVVAVASARAGEGKTSVATSLAVSITGTTKEPTLLIDADLRSPDVAKVLGVDNAPGLSEVLTGKASLDEAIHRVGETNTYVLPAGEQKVNPHHVLREKNIDELLDNLRTKFLTIVVDTPPVLAASESLIYAKAADLVVFCAMVDVSRSKQVREAVERLQTTGANVTGSVLNAVSFGRYAYTYGSHVYPHHSPGAFDQDS